MAITPKEITFDSLDPVIKNLFNLSANMKSKAYCPYSKFAVGAALLTEDGTIFTGCNVENASYGLSICAERTALVKAVSEGHKQFKAMVISTNMSDKFSSPCGACRQFIAEFGMDYDLYLTKPDLTALHVKVRDLLPYGFVPECLLT